MESNQASGFTPKPADQNEDTNDMAQLNPDWQVSKKCVKERTSVMFNNELIADVHFIVGSGSTQRRIPAHKFILATGSPVFYAMFYGGLAKDKKEVTIPDVEPQAFLNILRYLYCDDASLEADNVIPTLYAAKKYIIPHLAHACVEYLEANVDASNACLLLSQSRIFEEPELMQRCLGVIDLQAEEALQSDSFTDIDYQTLEQILGRDSLRARETMLFTAATKWAEAECTRQGSDVNSEQCRGVLGDVLYLLRLPTMSQKEFVEGPGESGLLSKQEVIDVFYFFSGKSTPDLRFPTSRRKGYDIETCSRFPGTKNTWSFSVGKSNSIQFSADKSISVAGFGLYGAREATEYRVDVALKENNGFVIGQKRHKMSVDGSNNTTRVLFDNPVQIEANIYYTVSFVVDYDGEGHYGLSGVARVICGNTNFTFKDSDATKNHTSVTKGQIPEILFYDDLTTL